MEPVLTVENVSAAYRKNEVLTDVNFQIKPGTLTSIVGPNGAGKSRITPYHYWKCNLFR